MPQEVINCDPVADAASDEYTKFTQTESEKLEKARVSACARESRGLHTSDRVPARRASPLVSLAFPPRT